MAWLPQTPLWLFRYSPRYVRKLLTLKEFAFLRTEFRDWKNRILTIVTGGTELAVAPFPSLPFKFVPNSSQETFCLPSQLTFHEKSWSYGECLLAICVGTRRLA